MAPILVYVHRLKQCCLQHGTSCVLFFSVTSLLYFCFSDLSTVDKVPGPSLFDQKASASGFEQQKQQKPVKVVYYRALYPFDARSHDEISIQPGDVIMVRTLTHSPQKEALESAFNTCFVSVSWASSCSVLVCERRVACINFFLSPPLCILKVKGEWVSPCPSSPRPRPVQCCVLLPITSQKQKKTLAAIGSSHVI